MDECGTVDFRNNFLGLVIMLLFPFIALYFLGLFIYCKLTGKTFLEQEAKEIAEAKRTNLND